MDNKNINNVVSINPYNNSYYQNNNNSIIEFPNLPYKKNQFTISYIDNKSLITSEISISKKIEDEDLFDAIYSKIYDELSLDQAIEYKVQYIEIFDDIDDNNRKIYVFIVDPSVIENIYKETIDTIKYIDFIIPAPLLYKSLYTNNIIKNNGVHAFLYFKENDTFLTVYKNKQFAYSKSINYSLHNLYERFCELYNKQIKYLEFIDFLSNTHLKTTNSPYTISAIKLFKEVFVHINEILTFVKKALDVNKIDHFYIGSEIFTKTKFDELAEVELEIKSSPLEFDYGFDNSQKYTDQLQSMMQLHVLSNNSLNYNCNFTLFPRPPKFIKRESGKLIIIILLSIFFALLYPFIYWILGYITSSQYDSTSKENFAIYNKKVDMQKQVKAKIYEKEQIISLLKKEKENYIIKKNTLQKIREVKVNYPMKSKIIYDLTKELNKYDVKLKHLLYKEKDNIKEVTLSLIAKEDRQITKLLEYLNKKYQNKYKLTLEKISYDNKTEEYFSELKAILL